MARARTVFRCQSCGGTAPKWAGRCPSCGEWNQLVEERDVPGPRVDPLAGGSPPVAIDEVSLEGWDPAPVGLAELDRVLGGGLVPGSVTLLGGEPGIGKSTLLLQAAAAVAGRGATVLYVTAEESTQQVRLRAERLAALRPRLLVVAEPSVPAVLAHVEATGPDLLVVDSIQTVQDPDLGSAPGSVAQVRESAARLVAAAKERGMATVLVGHVTKDGSLAGPRVLEHLVDTVLSFEGDRHHGLRLLRAVKHRFGPTTELGVLEMAGDGLRPVDDPSGLLLADRREGVPGSVVTATVEGRRPLLVEVQALTSISSSPNPRRSVQGLDTGRAAMVLAVLAERAGVPVGMADVYALAVGGVRVPEPAADLALALAVASAMTDDPLPEDLVAVGELGLGGELRQVAHADQRLREAARLGFRRAVVPFTAPEPPEGIDALRAATLADALALVGIDVDRDPLDGVALRPAPGASPLDAPRGPGRGGRRRPDPGWEGPDDPFEEPFG